MEMGKINMFNKIVAQVHVKLRLITFALEEVILQETIVKQDLRLMGLLPGILKSYIFSLIS